MTDLRGLLAGTAGTAADYLEGVRDRPVAQPADLAALVAALGGPLPDGPTTADDVVRHLVEAADPGLVVTNGGRYFGFVIGGSLPVALAADTLASAWDQIAGLSGFVARRRGRRGDRAAPGSLDLLGLPPASSSGFITGGQMAHFTCRSAAAAPRGARGGAAATSRPTA